MEDWRKEICVAFLVKQAVSRFGRLGNTSCQLPEVGASLDDLRIAEKRLGFRLDLRFREFLTVANGWYGFYRSIDLLGCQDMQFGKRRDRAHELLDQIETQGPSCPLRRHELYPIAVSLETNDIVVVGKRTSSDPGAVYWINDDGCERFESFDEFFLLLVDFGRSDYVTLHQKLA